MNRYVAGFLLAVGLIVLVIILIVRSLVSPSSSSPLTKTDLTSYASTGTSVQFTIDSPVSSPDKHNDIIINVSNYQTTLTVTQGYQGQVIRTQTYPMNTNAYAVFLSALKLNGFDQGNRSDAARDERGHCALGNRYIYQVIDSSNEDIQRFWSTSCGSGTFSGSADTIRRLFIMQVPDYSKQLQGLNIFAS